MDENLKRSTMLSIVPLFLTLLPIMSVYIFAHRSQCNGI